MEFLPKLLSGVRLDLLSMWDALARPVAEPRKDRRWRCIAGVSMFLSSFLVIAWWRPLVLSSRWCILLDSFKVTCLHCCKKGTMLRLSNKEKLVNVVGISPDVVIAMLDLAEWCQRHGPVTTVCSTISTTLPASQLIPMLCILLVHCDGRTN